MNIPSRENGLGWNEWFAEKTDCTAPCSVARVAAVDREQLLLVDQTGHFRAKLSGGFRHRFFLASEQPCVGDWVCCEKETGGDIAIIHSCLERKTSLRRKMAGDKVEYQMIAANVDCVVIVQSCHFDFNLKRLERYLVMIADGGAEPCILLTKTDLVEASVLASQIQEIRHAGIAVPVLTLSNVTREGVDALRQILEAGKTYCFVGSSGVGKSTLINQLTEGEKQETGAVSGTGEGRHTTVRRELIRLAGGALVIDNPGMRELGILGAEEGIGSSYADITDRAASCRFRNCTHAGEPGCAVLAAVRSGEINREHFDNYLKIGQESDFYQLSYADKRKKDRDFGKFIKSVKKGLKK